MENIEYVNPIIVIKTTFFTFVKFLLKINLIEMSPEIIPTDLHLKIKAPIDAKDHKIICKG